MKIAYLVPELHYLKLMWGKHPEHIDVLCDVNPKTGISNFVFKFHEKRNNLLHMLLIFKPHV